MPGRTGRKLKLMYRSRVGDSEGDGSYSYINKFEPLPWQVEPWADTSPILLLTGSAGGGKSRLAAEKIVGFCFRYPGAQALVLRKTATSLSNSALLLLQRLVIKDDPRVIHRVNKERFEFENGSIISYGGMADAKQREKIRSIGIEGGVDICWMEEATQFEEEDFNEVSARMRGNAAPWRQIILTTNPDAPGHWINMRLILGGEASIYRSSATDNPYNPEDYIASLSKLTGVQRQRLLEGLWVVGSGIIFDTWADAYNAQTGRGGNGSVLLEADYIPDGGPVIWAVDDGYSGRVDKATGMYTGKSHPRAILMTQRRANGQLCVFAEHYAIKTLADNQLRDASRMARDNGWPVRPGHFVRDRAAASISGVIRGMYGMDPRYNRIDVEESIKEAREWFAMDSNGIRRCVVHPRCKNLRFEMNSYSYNQDGNVIKQHDNGPDALRYLIWDEAYGLPSSVDVVTIGDGSDEDVILDDDDLDRQLLGEGYGDVDIAVV